jgi:hypothetical protein
VTSLEVGAGVAQVAPASPHDSAEQRYVAWFHELDAWTEYWDVYHPETRGRFYFGDGRSEVGFLTQLLPREKKPPVFEAWVRWALKTGDLAAFEVEARRENVARAVLEVDALVARLFRKHFGCADALEVRNDYLEAIQRFAEDSLPTATERLARLAPDDARAATAGRHTLDGDIMWFAWALHTQASMLLGDLAGHARRTLMLAGVFAGCAANFAWRGHRRTRDEYTASSETRRLLRERAHEFQSRPDALIDEIGALYRIREWGASIEERDL